MIYRCLIMVLLLLYVQSNAADDTTLSIPRALQDRIEKVLNKAGISFGGEIRAGLFSSVISGSGINPEGRTKESDGFGAVDFDIHARPNDAIGGRVILRVHHNWENLFSDPGNPIFSRWISIDGNIGGCFPLHISDFTDQFSPLTLAMPRIDLLYEPEMFSRLRKNAMKEFFIDENNRPLQGLNAGFDRAFQPLFDRFAFRILGSRLRSAGTTDIKAQKVVNTYEEASPFSTYFFGTNLDTRFLKNYALGGSWLVIGDHKNSARLPDNLTRGRTSRQIDSVVNTMVQKTRIADVRATCAIAPLSGLPGSEVRLYGEAAFSFDDTAWYSAATLNHDAIYGSAVYGGIAAKMNVSSEVKVDADVRYLRNKADFRNELAQTPGFIGNRIMNVEGDSMNGSCIIPNHYSTFDALYHNVFKFCPGTATNLWHKAPFVKSSYSNNVYTQRTLDGIADSMLDPAVQLVMPFGEATPDRQGITMNVTGSWEKGGIEMQLLFSALTGERLPAWRPASDDPLALKQTGGGLSWNISALVRQLPYPFVISGSFVRSSRVTDTIGDSDIGSDFINAGLSWQLLKQLTVYVGAQRIVTRFNSMEVLRQTHFSAGPVWSVTPGVDVFLTWGRIAVSGKDELSNAGNPYQYLKGSFNQRIIECSMMAHF